MNAARLSRAPARESTLQWAATLGAGNLNALHAAGLALARPSRLRDAQLIESQLPAQENERRLLTIIERAELPSPPGEIHVVVRLARLQPVRDFSFGAERRRLSFFGHGQRRMAAEGGDGLADVQLLEVRQRLHVRVRLAKGDVVASLGFGEPGRRVATALKFFRLPVDYAESALRLGAYYQAHLNWP